MIGPVCGPVVGTTVGGAAADGATVGGFTPTGLFSAGEVGAWYDPSDLSTLFQDHACTTPVTAVDQSVAFMLDKSLGLARGAEQAVGGYATVATFDNVTTTLTPTSFQQVGGTTASRSYLNITAAAGLLVEVTGRLASISVGTMTVFGRNATNGGGSTIASSLVLSSGNSFRFVFFATAASQSVLFVTSTVGASSVVDTLSVRTLPGLHVGQLTAGMRPLLKQDAGGRYLLRFDGVDDGIFTPYLPAGQAFPFTVACAAKAGADILGSPFGVWGGAPPYYETQKTGTVGQWRAFVRGTVNYSNNETGGTSVPNVLTSEFTATTVNLRIDGTDPTVATTQDNLIGTITDIRIANGGGGFFNGDFYGGVVRFGTMTTQQRASLERFLANKSGAALP